METVTQADLLEALRKALEAAPAEDLGAMTAEAMAAAVGLNVKTLRAKLKPFVFSGQFECVRIRIQRIDGTYQLVPAYRLRPSTR